MEIPLEIIFFEMGKNAHNGSQMLGFGSEQWWRVMLPVTAGAPNKGCEYPHSSLVATYLEH